MSIAEEKRLIRKKLIREFEAMRDTAEIRALSSLSLERPLTDAQFRRMMELKEKIFGELNVT